MPGRQVIDASAWGWRRCPAWRATSSHRAGTASGVCCSIIGETFYNFRGLRSFKDKFDPVWEPRYLAAGGGITPLLTLGDVAALISGRLRGVIAK